MLDDAKAAYNYARTLGGAPDRGVIVGGASAGTHTSNTNPWFKGLESIQPWLTTYSNYSLLGFFMATITAHHLAPKPLALLSITGIPTFQHPFFNSSYLIPPEPISEEEVEPYLVGPATVGKTPYPPSVFYLERLLPSGAKNPDFEEPKQVLGMDPSQDPNRGLLYDYFLYLNAYEPLVSSVDPGYEWASNGSQVSRLAEWPVTVLIQGDADDDVKMDVCADTARWLGEEKGRLYVAKGQPHLFEMAKFLEDRTPGMEAVRQALHALDAAVAAARK